MSGWLRVGQRTQYDHTHSVIMSDMTRVTVTLPTELVEEIDRMERNRSRFVAEGVRREIRRRRREALRRSLRSPHPESSEIAEEGLTAWADALPEDNVAELIDLEVGAAVRWVPGEGWVEGAE